MGRGQTLLQGGAHSAARTPSHAILGTSHSVPTPSPGALFSQPPPTLYLHTAHTVDGSASSPTVWCLVLPPTAPACPPGCQLASFPVSPLSGQMVPTAPLLLSHPAGTGCSQAPLPSKAPRPHWSWADASSVPGFALHRDWLVIVRRPTSPRSGGWVTLMRLVSKTRARHGQEDVFPPGRRGSPPQEGL